jgi:hypothetical protein
MKFQNSNLWVSDLSSKILLLHFLVYIHIRFQVSTNPHQMTSILLIAKIAKLSLYGYTETLDIPLRSTAV